MGYFIAFMIGTFTGVIIMGIIAGGKENNNENKSKIQYRRPYMDCI